MIQVYKKNGLFVIENTVTDIIYPNLTREESINLLKKFDRDEPESRCDFSINDEDISFKWASLDDKDKAVADLEAKLAEMQNEKDELISKYRYWKGECAELKQQLAEKDKAIENWRYMYEGVVQSCHNGIEEDKRLEKLLTESDERYKKAYQEGLLQKQFDKDAEIVELKRELAEHSKHREWVSEFLERYKIDPESTPKYSENPMIEYCEQVYDFRLCDDAEIKDLQEQLADYKKDNEQLEDRLHTAEQETLHFQNKYFDMQHKLKEKEKEIEDYQKLINDTCNKYRVCSLKELPISFALEQLEKVKELINNKLEFMWQNNAEMTCRDRHIIEKCYEDIEELITEIKEMK